MNGITLIANERARQRLEEGFDHTRDAAYLNAELPRGAIAYEWSADTRYATGKVPGCVPFGWPWSANWFKSTSVERDLTKAGALYMAEAERATLNHEISAAKMATTLAIHISKKIDRLRDADREQVI